MQENKEGRHTKIISNENYFAEVKQMLAEGKEVRIRIKGGSMQPFIKDGDTVLLRSYQGEPLALGSNVLAKDRDKYVFHRFVGMKNGQFVLAGDGNLVLREYVDKAAIVAIASMHYRKDSLKGKAIDSIGARIGGLAWYHIRLLRRIIAKLTR
jgi:SOS-response transcriptional repressor LexA